ncbi:TauD/TfdA family dioxygenase [soil metagenome]
MTEHPNRRDPRAARAWDVHYEDGPIRTVVTGLQATEPLQAQEAMRLRLVLADRGVVILPGQAVTGEQQARFNASFGPVELSNMQAFPDAVHRNIVRLSNQADGTDFAHYWHMDASSRFRPTTVSSLHAVAVPEGTPTSTMFLSAALAYDGLPLGLLRRLNGLKWIVGERTRAPILRAHPLTNRPLLWLPLRFERCSGSDAELRAMLDRLNGGIRPRIEDVGEAECEALMFMLIRHLTSRPEWIYEHTWSPGDLVLWDQSTVYHRAGTTDDRLILHRTAVRGDPAVPFSPPTV